jgi:predicted permease
MRTIGDGLAQEHPENRLKTVTLTPLRDRLTGSVRMTLWILMSAVGVVWLIACANVANLLLARAAGRTREIALRAALGAGRGRVVRQLLAESGVLAAAAGLAGLLLAFLLVRGIVAFSPADLPRINDVQVDTTVLLFAIGLSLLSTALFGLVPALQASRLDLSDALKQGGSKATASKAGTRIRTGLVVAEVALSVVLLATAGLLARSFQALQHVDLGFTTGRVLAAYTEYPVEDSDHIPNRIGFFADVLDRLRSVPGVDAAAGAAYLGMGWEPRAPRDVFVDGRPEGQPGERPQAEIYDVTEDYFGTLEIPILAGRDFSRTDTRDSPRVALINETLARIAFPGESPLGQRIRETPNSQVPSMEIVGVVGDARWQDPSQPAPPVVFRSAMQGTGNSPSILVRTSLDEASIVPTLRGILNEADPTVPVEFETMEGMFDSTLVYPRFRTQVIGLFAGLATILATVGLFSVLAYLVGQRTRELALRRALGARAANVIRLVVGQGLRLVAIGLVLGLAGALAVSRLLTGLLFEIGPWDVGTYFATVVVLGGVALLATLVPAIRAATIAPAIVLQQE